MKTSLYTTALALALTFGFISCEKDEPVKEPVNEEEVITTVKLTFTPQGGGTDVVLSIKDADGSDGPALPVQAPQVGTFVQNKTYNCAVTFLNEMTTPAGNITEEVKNEGADHQVFYSVVGTLPSFTYALGAGNVDANGKPIGINTTFTTTTASSGEIKVTLKHSPNKSAAGVANGDITNAGGSTDAEAVFKNIKID